MSLRTPFLASFLLVGLLMLSATAQTADSPWVNLGNALAGTLGPPQLAVKGPLTSGSPLSIQLANAVPNQKAYLVIGFNAIYAPYKGGILVPDDDLLQIFPTGDAGSVKIVAHWPPGVPSGLPIFMQFWINDEAAPAGRAGSNAVGALTP